MSSVRQKYCGNTILGIIVSQVKKKSDFELFYEPSPLSSITIAYS